MAAGSWLQRACRAIFRERRLPTQLAIARERLWIALGRRCKVISAGELSFCVRRLQSDEFFIRDVVLDREYNPAGYEIGESDIVIDAGGSIGAFAVLAARAARRGTVVSLEPTRDSFRLLGANLARNNCTSATAVQAALVGTSGPVKIYLSRHSTGGHSVFADLAGQAESYEMVDGLTLAEVFQRHQLTRCDFLKLDCEGAEFAILDSLPEDLAEQIGKIVVEYHVQPGEPKASQAERLLQRIDRLGFRVERYTDVVDTYWGTIYARRPAQ
ncbi:MAG TPA: FkbM family methyltransferase [Pirellulaceae bacterium]|nr:FkbM family methyltransferase [Pirellulaceae bacterium]